MDLQARIRAMKEQREKAKAQQKSPAPPDAGQRAAPEPAAQKPAPPQETETEQTAEPAPQPAQSSQRFAVPTRRRIISSNPAPKQSVAQETEPTPTPPTETEQEPATKPKIGGGIGALLANSKRTSDVTPAVNPVFDQGEFTTAEEFQEMWEALQSEEEQINLEFSDLENPHESADYKEALEGLTAQRKHIIERMGNEINKQSLTLLQSYSIGQISIPQITPLSKIVHLTFLRVKESPSAYYMLDREDRSKIIKGLRFISAYRSSTVSRVQGKKAAGNLSQSMADDIGQVDDGTNEIMQGLSSALGGDFDAF